MHKISRLRRFHGEPVRRLIVSVPMETVEAIDALYINKCGWYRGNRSEFIRLAVEERLARMQAKNVKPDD